LGVKKTEETKINCIEHSRSRVAEKGNVLHKEHNHSKIQLLFKMMWVVAFQSNTNTHFSKQEQYTKCPH